MQLKLYGAALAAFLYCAPASANVLWEIQIDVFATGNTQTPNVIGSPVDPYQGYFTFLRHLYPFEGTVDINSGFDSPFADPFELGSTRYFLSGNLTFANGQFTGTNLVYQSNNCRLGGLNCRSFDLRANTFGASYVQTTGGGPPPVPEPGTWATMLLGLGAVGFSMRRRRKVPQAPLGVA